MLYQIRNGLVKYAATTVLDYINFEIRDTEKIAIIGRNGCGKSTLLKLIAGILTLDNLDSDELSYIQTSGSPRIGYLEQMSFEDENLLVEEELRKVYEPIFLMENRIHELIERMNYDSSESLLKEYGYLQERFENCGGYTYEQDLITMFTKFGFLLSDLKRPISTFSGGQKTRINFIQLLLSKPDILLLDEPTNHLDIATTEWLEGYLKNYNKAVVIVSHDRMFLDRIVDVTYEIEYNKTKRYPGNYSYYEERKHLDFEKQAKDYLEQQAEITRLLQLVERFKNTPSKVAMTRSKLKQIEHMPTCPPPVRYDLKSFHANFTPDSLGGKEILNVRNLQIGYNTTLSTVSFQINRGERVAILGENGIGKSTLLKTIMAQIPALGGTYSYGHDVSTGYFSQELTLDTQDKTILDNFWDDFSHLTQTEVRSSLGNFLFTKDDVFKKVSQLSGGEKVRLLLSKILKRKPNFLLLDEPTNHLDIVGKEALESMLTNFKGTVLYVSHDRYFVKKTATSLLVFEQEKAYYYPFGYDEYLEYKSKKDTKIDGTNRLQNNGKLNNKVSLSANNKLNVNNIFNSNSNFNHNNNLNTSNNSIIADKGPTFNKPTNINPGKEAAKL